MCFKLDACPDACKNCLNQSDCKEYKDILIMMQVEADDYFVNNVCENCVNRNNCKVQCKNKR